MGNTGTSRRSWRALAGVVVAATAVATIAVAAPATADHTADDDPWVVTLGDSAISGEAGRWAGNTNNSYTLVDAGGADAYYDNANRTAEQIPGCHRSESAEAHIGVPGVNSLNLACSGARTYTQTGGDFKPGIDFHHSSAGKGQARMLQDFAAGHDVDAVVLLIGANNYGFADIVTQCVLNWTTSPWWWKNYCNDDSSIRNRFTSSAITARTAEVRGAIDNIVTAMGNAGQDPDTYTLIVQTYWSPVPRGGDIRYSERGWSRQSIGGCGIWNRDADWANDVAVVAMNKSLKDAAASARTAYGASGLDIEILDMQRALDGHRLCERGVGLLEEVGVPHWTSPNAADRTEWVSQVRTLTTILGPYQLQEDIHSSYWGQLAMRNCLRQAYLGDDGVTGGACTPAAGGGLNERGEPNMTLN